MAYDDSNSMLRRFSSQRQYMAGVFRRGLREARARGDAARAQAIFDEANKQGYQVAGLSNYQNRMAEDRARASQMWRQGTALEGFAADPTGQGQAQAPAADIGGGLKQGQRLVAMGDGGYRVVTDAPAQPADPANRTVNGVPYMLARPPENDGQSPVQGPQITMNPKRLDMARDYLASGMGLDEWNNQRVQKGQAPLRHFDQSPEVQTALAERDNKTPVQTMFAMKPGFVSPFAPRPAQPSGETVSAGTASPTPPVKTISGPAEFLGGSPTASEIMSGVRKSPSIVVPEKPSPGEVDSFIAARRKRLEDRFRQSKFTNTR